MPVLVITRTGVTPSVRSTPTNSTLTVTPMTVDRVGCETAEDESPTRVSSLQEAFVAYAPPVDFRTYAGAEGTEFVVQADFRCVKDFDSKQLRIRQPGKRNDVADLQARIDLQHRMRERFATLRVRRAWQDLEQPCEIMATLRDYEMLLRRVAGSTPTPTPRSSRAGRPIRPARVAVHRGTRVSSRAT